MSDYTDNVNKESVKSAYDSSQETAINNSVKNFVLENSKLFDEVWGIGGTAIYEHFYKEYYDQINKIYITQVYKDYECDAFFPTISDDFKTVSVSKTEEVDENTKQEITVEYKILERTEK